MLVIRLASAWANTCTSRVKIKAVMYAPLKSFALFAHSSGAFHSYMGNHISLDSRTNYALSQESHSHVWFS